MSIFLMAPVFAALDRRRDARWTPRMLACAAIFMMWDSAPTLRGKLAAALATLADVFPSRRRPGRTYQGFVKALLHEPQLLEVVVNHLRQANDSLDFQFRDGWRAFAVDGSRIDCPRTRANEKAFGVGGRTGSGPQMWLTTLLHMGTGLPWAWRIGPANSSEREHLREMLEQLPQGALLVADAGFVGYDLLRTLHQSEQSFLIRVGGNVTLLRELGYGVEEKRDTVYLWPLDQRGKAPLTLRLIKVNSGGKVVYLLTNVRDRKALSRRKAARLYRMRWGVEVFYRSFKDTLDRRKMRGASPKVAMAELHWSLVGLLLLGLMNVQAIIKRGGDPLEASVAAALQVVRDVMRGLKRLRRSLTALISRFAQAVKDRHHRRSSKEAREWPHKKTDRPPAPPRLRKASASEVAAARAIRERLAME